MGRPELHVRAYSPLCFVVSGPGAARIIMAVNGDRVPIYSNSLRGYVIREKTADKVMATADHERRSVVFTDHRELKLVDLSPEPEHRRRHRDVAVPEPDSNQLELDLDGES